MLNIKQYFNGKVQSIGFQNASVGQASIGVMLPGEYIFSTDNPEEMTVITGSLKVLLPTAKDWQIFEMGQIFHIVGESQFDVVVVEPTAYLCRYLAKY